MIWCLKFYLLIINIRSSKSTLLFHSLRNFSIFTNFYMFVKDSNGQICGGGVSVYYSHALRLLFFSYSHGKSFLAPLESGSTQLTDAFLINLSRPTGSGSGSSGSGGSSSGNNKGGNSSSGQPQPLCLWTEVANHPGIVCATLQTSKL